MRKFNHDVIFLALFYKICYNKTEKQMQRQSVGKKILWANGGQNQY